MASLRQHFSFQFAAALSSLLFPLISFPYLAHTLGPEMLGRVNYVDYLAGLVLTITCLGVPLYGTRETARLSNDATGSRRILSGLTGLWGLAGLAGIVLFTGFLLWHPRFREEGVLILLGGIYIISNILSSDWYFQGREQFRYLAVRNIALRAAGLVFLFLFIRVPGDYSLYYALIAGTQVAILLLNYSIARPRLVEMNPVTAWREHRQTLIYFFIVSAFVTLYDYTDTVILGWLKGDAEVGYYTAAAKLVRMSLLLIITSNTILFPRFSSLLAETETEKARALLKKAIEVIAALAIPAVVLYAALAPQLIAVFAGPDFAPAVPVMRWLSPLPLLIALSNLFLLYYLAGFPRFRGLWIWVPVILTLNLGINALLIPLWNEQGAAITSLITEGLIFILFSFRMKISWPHRTLLQTGLASLMMLPVIWLTTQFLKDPLGILLVASGSGAVCYLLLQIFLFRHPFFRESWQRLIHQKNMD